MIVRDEALVIDRCLSSVAPFIDYWVIVDTGSTDNTPVLVEKTLAGIPGELHHRPWKNFGHNRTEALELAKDKAGYLLFIDADEQLGAPSDAQWPTLDQPAYSIEARYAELVYDRLSLVSTKYPWRWEGVLHEYPTLGSAVAVAQPRIPGFWIQITSDGARSKDPEKFRKDAEILLDALQKEPNNERYAFYLAQSYRDFGELSLSLQYYDQRASMGGWDEEIWYSLYQCAKLKELLGYPHDEIIGAYLRAYEQRPSRAETMVSLAAYCRGREDWNTGYLMASRAININMPDDRLFLDVWAYRWKAADELALAAFYTNKKDEASVLWKELLLNPIVPAPDRDRIRNNLKFI